MLVMNKLCIVLILFILFSSCYGPKLNEKKIKVQIHFISKINSDKIDAKEGIFYSIKIDLINNGDSTDRFWIMSCSWEEIGFQTIVKFNSTILVVIKTFQSLLN